MALAEAQVVAEQAELDGWIRIAQNLHVDVEQSRAASAQVHHGEYDESEQRRSAGVQPAEARRDY